MTEIKVNRLNIKINSNPKRVLPLFLNLHGEYRFQNIVSKVLSLSNEEVTETLNKILNEFSWRHFFLKKALLKHYFKVEKYVPKPDSLTESRKLLIGSYFTMEYSVEAAALFNPSIVIHPDQSGLNTGETRLIISFRATGEGHISSIEFRTAILSNNNIVVEPVDRKIDSGDINRDQKLSVQFIISRLGYYDNIDKEIADLLPQEFSLKEAIGIINKLNSIPKKEIRRFQIFLEDIFDSNYDIIFDKNIPLSSRILFPLSNGEKMGMEDARFVKFQDNNDTIYLATYTAYDGRQINSKLIETKDFCHFKIRKFYGDAINDKGMAIFPEKINGQYVITGRQGGECISIMWSNDLLIWDSFKTIRTPEHTWEITQIGNNGSPVKTKHGWLLLTHAVGPMRQYTFSATLLDLKDPSKVIGSLKHPLLYALDTEREGYVPNVVYTCGVLLQDDMLIIPYAMSDSATSFAMVKTEEILNEILKIV